ncbi:MULTISPECIES: stage V sporulation protein AE [Bacillaceae]|uniref:Stage V sporulation protein AEB n=2 Tax=Bacillaceae TaxID=186817 RepID=A0A9D5HYL2_9BACI|nr:MULTISPECIES: stage V sporulation protein AE [Bacillaceae]KQL57876.1 stage V sporulation protein AEB [Alkalicoccobacillus plakortidis]MBG9785826.1 stage V sporulation protein AEB [Shouchella lehensis]TES48294.1 stage V sporulation protein AE [Shouchella lehensis]
MIYLWAFVIGGSICLFGQFLLDIVKLTSIQMLVTLVLIGIILDGFGLYEQLIDFAGAGATVPITGFGYSLVHGAMLNGENGLFYISDGVFELASTTIVFSILLSLIVAAIFKPKGVT